MPNLPFYRDGSDGNPLGFGFGREYGRSTPLEGRRRAQQPDISYEPYRDRRFSKGGEQVVQGQAGVQHKTRSVSPPSSSTVRAANAGVSLDGELGRVLSSLQSQLLLERQERSAISQQVAKLQQAIDDRDSQSAAQQQVAQSAALRSTMLEQRLASVENSIRGVIHRSESAAADASTANRLQQLAEELSSLNGRVEAVQRTSQQAHMDASGALDGEAMARGAAEQRIHTQLAALQRRMDEAAVLAPAHLRRDSQEALQSGGAGSGTENERALGLATQLSTLRQALASEMQQRSLALLRLEEAVSSLEARAFTKEDELVSRSAANKELSLKVEAVLGAVHGAVAELSSRVSQQAAVTAGLQAEIDGATSAGSNSSSSSSSTSGTGLSERFASIESTLTRLQDVSAKREQRLGDALVRGLQQEGAARDALSASVSVQLKEVGERLRAEMQAGRADERAARRQLDGLTSQLEQRVTDATAMVVSDLQAGLVTSFQSSLEGKAQEVLSQVTSSLRAQYSSLTSELAAELAAEKDSRLRVSSMLASRHEEMEAYVQTWAAKFQADVGAWHERIQEDVRAVADEAVARMRPAVDPLEGRLQEVEAELQRLQSAHLEAVVSLETRVALAEEQQQRQQGELEAVLDAQADVDEKVLRQGEDLTSLQSSIGAYETLAAQKVQGVEGTLADLTSAVRKQEAQLGQVKSASDGSASSLRYEIDSLRASVESSLRQAACEMSSSHASSAHASASEVAALTAAIAKAKDQMDALVREGVAGLQTQCDELRAQMAKLDSLSRLVDRHDAAITSLRRTTDGIDAPGTRSALEALKLDVEGLRADASTQDAARQAAAAAAAKGLRKLEGEVAALKAQVATELQQALEATAASSRSTTSAAPPASSLALARLEGAIKAQADDISRHSDELAILSAAQQRDANKLLSELAGLRQQAAAASRVAGGTASDSSAEVRGLASKLTQLQDASAVTSSAVAELRSGAGRSQEMLQLVAQSVDRHKEALLQHDADIQRLSGAASVASAAVDRLASVLSKQEEVIASVSTNAATSLASARGGAASVSSAGGGADTSSTASDPDSPPFSALKIDPLAAAAMLGPDGGTASSAGALLSSLSSAVESLRQSLLAEASERAALREEVYAGLQREASQRNAELDDLAEDTRSQLSSAYEGIAHRVVDSVGHQLQLVVSSINDLSDYSEVVRTVSFLCDAVADAHLLDAAAGVAQDAALELIQQVQFDVGGDGRSAAAASPVSATSSSSRSNRRQPLTRTTSEAGLLAATAAHNKTVVKPSLPHSASSCSNSPLGQLARSNSGASLLRAVSASQLTALAASSSSGARSPSPPVVVTAAAPVPPASLPPIPRGGSGLNLNNNMRQPTPLAAVRAGLSGNETPRPVAP